jgi:hypothetical protein
MEDDYLLMFKTIAILEPEYCLIFCESLLLALLVTITNTVLVVSALVLGIVLVSTSYQLFKFEYLRPPHHNLKVCTHIVDRLAVD